jgi:hypothetical protein
MVTIVRFRYEWCRRMRAILDRQRRIGLVHRRIVPASTATDRRLIGLTAVT